MSSKTTNYQLVKLELSDPADITRFNDNWDTIDAELKEQSGQINDVKANHKTLSDTVNANKTKLDNKITTEVTKLQKKITYGTVAPSGGSDGDVYIQLI